ncbi:GAF domain-containing protein [Gemella sp. zg-570]|uniref:GAF domain-containing protein n=1 Tax=Gemella sp. zg-570 TaxID=2840371 RepID=UPI001C0AB484|nr:GAF domain-containing protein [Gemella sp. zg-570]QWQ39378.1 GAF domain-containing protein [Gemella sp. zg-570]
MKKNIIIAQAKSLINDENNLYANLANLSALFKEYLPDTNWVGFYLVDFESKNLVLGPFQGKVACVRIPFNKGVCGKCYTDKKTIYVENVHEFPGHIACDSASNSELVIPILDKDKVVALLDIDSVKFNRFSEEEINSWTNIVEEIFKDFKIKK